MAVVEQSTSYRLPQLPRFNIVRFQSGNRQERRRALSQTNIVADLAIEMNNVSVRLTDTASKWDGGVTGGRSLGAAIFRGNDSMIPWIKEDRTLGILLPKWHSSFQQIGFPSVDDLKVYDAYDFFNQRLGVVNRWHGLVHNRGISLREVEEMDPDLSINDIRRINRLFMPKDFDFRANVVRQAALFLVAEPAARPEKKVPVELTPLHDRLQDYFDYWLSKFLNFEASIVSDLSLARTFINTNPYLPRSLGYYAMATLGITPASMVKLIDTKVAETQFPDFVWKRRAGIDYMKTAARDSFRTTNLASDLYSLRDINPDSDETASFLLAGFYKREKMTDSQVKEAFDQMMGLQSTLIDRYFKVLHTDIMRAPLRKITLDMPQNHAIESITLASQNREVLIMVLNMADGQTRLLLEMDRERKYYGFPAKFVSSFGEFIPLVFKDVLPEILKFARSKHPEIEGREGIMIRASSLSTSVLTSDTSVISSAPGFRIRSKPEMQSEEDISPVKREPKRRVIYTRGRIVDLMGGHPRTQDVDAIIDVLKRYQKGEIDAKPIDWSGGKRRSLRVRGNLRVILNPLKGGRDVVEVIADREEAYERYADHKV